MRILTRYILREVLSHALLGGLLFTFVLFTPNIGSLLDLIVRNSSSAMDVFKIFLFMMPNMFTLTIPMSVLVGVLLGLSRLAADSEITAMRASGIGVWTFVRVVAVIGVLGWGVDMVNSLYLAPHASAAMIALKDDLKNSQASFEVQPRVFYEDFKNMVLYVDDVVPSTGAARWRKVFLADLTDPATPRVTTAAQAVVVNSGTDEVTMRLRNGTQHQLEAANPNQYDVSTFAQTDLPLVSSGSGDEDVHVGRNTSPVLAMSNAELHQRMKGPTGRWYRIEMDKRYSYPAACLVLMLVGVPLGMSSKRGGKSAGFVLTIALVFIYYFFSSTGVALARQSKVPVEIGVWGANVLFGAAGLVLLQRLSRVGGALPSLPWLSFFTRRGASSTDGTIDATGDETEDGLGAAVAGTAVHGGARQHRERERQTRSHFPLILDDYVIREFLKTFAMVLLTFVMLLLLFTFFELLGDIIRNRTPFVIVGEYLANLTPSMIYTIAPLSVLIAVLVVFGGLNRTNELTAMKATGISVYRIVVPILAISSILALALFSFDELYIPQANRKQEALRAEIKGRPAQTFERPDQKWIFGIEKPGEPSHIFYYQFFDPDRDSFANISVFEFDSNTFTLTRRLYATSAHWDPNLHTWLFEHGWERTFAGDEVKTYSTFQVTTLGQLHEPPQYFKKETRQSTEMSFAELSRYIGDLRQSGFDTMRLRVQLNHKLAYPLITLVMAVLAVPFALSMGRSGSLAGIGVAIGVAVVYWVVDGTFEAMGNVNMLPALLAAWSPDILFALAGSYLLLRTPT